MDSASIYLGFFKSVLHGSFSTPTDHRVFGGRYVVVDKSDNLSWLTEEVKLKLLSRGKKKVLSYDGVELKIWESASEFIRNTKLSKKAVTTSLKKNKFRLINGIMFCYLKDYESDSKILIEKAKSL